MPGGDGTGPMGMGPMTGRAAGFCAGFAVPGFANPFGGRGFWGRGRGRGGGRGWRNWFYATGLPGWQRAAMGWPFAAGAAFAAPAPQQELEMLRAQAGGMEQALEDCRRRIEELSAQLEAEKKDT